MGTKEACPLSSFFSTPLFLCGERMWFPLVPLYVYAADAQHPLFIASLFAELVELRYIQVLARYIGYQSMSSFLILSYTVFIVRRTDICSACCSYHSIHTLRTLSTRSSSLPRSHNESN